MKVLMADAPIAGLEAVNVTITKLEALYDGQTDSRLVAPQAGQTISQNTVPDDNDRWITVVSQPHTLNLLDYANKPTSSLFALANINVPSGHYKRFRFTIGSVEVVANSVHVNVTLDHTTVEVPSGGFVNPQVSTTFVVDFDVNASLISQGSELHCAPVLRLLQQDVSGTVSGLMKFPTTLPAGNYDATVELTNSSGEVVAGTMVELVSDGIEATGRTSYVIHAVPPGSYTLRVTVHGTSGSISATVPVTVAPGQSVEAAPTSTST
jgi:uncharacterized protein DUF4382